MSDAKEKTKESDSSGGGGTSKIVMILSVVNLVVVIVVAAFVFISFKKENSAEKITDISPEEEVASAHGESKGGHGEAKSEHGGGGGGGHGGGGEHGGGGSAKKKEGSRWVTLEQFTVNLNTPGGSAQRFVRVNISVEAENEEVEAEVQAKMPQVRNTIIDLFNSKRPGDLANGEGRDFLREEIRAALKSFILTGKVKGVYFTNFAVTS